MKRVLVLGAGGMAGHATSLYLREKGYEVDTLSARNKLDNNTMIIDVMDKATFEVAITDKQYDVVINAIGILVKQSEDRKDMAAYLNGYLPHQLEYLFANANTKVIHLSTDCVFSGKNAPYEENSPYDGEPFYDRSKALGEIKNDKDLTFRMSIIGPDMQPTGIGLFNWFYAQTGEILGFTNAIWSGITTIELAKGIDAAIQQNLTGLYHLVPSTNISKYDLVRLFVEVFNRNDITVKPDGKLALDKTLVNTRIDFNHTVPDYKTMITEMKEWINSHKELYEHYN